MFKEIIGKDKKCKSFYFKSGKEKMKLPNREFASQPQKKSHYDFEHCAPSLNFNNSQEDNPHKKFEDCFESSLSSWTEVLEELQMESQTMWANKNKD